MATRSFWNSFSRLPKPQYAFSTYVGTTLLLTNAAVRLSDLDNAIIELTRPLSEVVCVAGVTMTVMLPVREYKHTNFGWWLVSMVGHALVGLSALGTAITLAGVALATATLLAALLVYWWAHAFDVWPYQLAPLEIVALCVSMLSLRLL